MRKTLVSVVFVCVLAGLVAGGAAAKHKPGKKLAKKPVATAPWDCSVLMPASTFGSLVGGSVTLGAVFESAAHLVSNCNYGGDLVVVNAKTGATDYDPLGRGRDAVNDAQRCDLHDAAGRRSPRLSADVPRRRRRAGGGVQPERRRPHRRPHVRPGLLAGPLALLRPARSGGPRAGREGQVARAPCR